VSDRRIEYMPLDALKAHPRNPKDHDLGEIVRSIRRFGFLDAVIIDERTGQLVSGHGRVEALRAMHRENQHQVPTGIGPPPMGQDGTWWVPVQRGWSSANEREAEAFIIAANRLVEVGGYQQQNLEAILFDLAKAGDEALAGIGFDMQDVERMLNEATKAALGSSDPNDVEMPKDVWVKPGDLIALGRHRLLCGDSTLAENVDRLREGGVFDVCWTDPPYGVNYESKAGKVHNDDPEGLPKLLAGAFAQVARVLKPGGFVYVAHPAGRHAMIFAEQVVAAGLTYRQGLVWVKDSLVLGPSDYHYEHEPILYAMKPATQGRRGRGGQGWYGDNAQTTVFRFAKPKRSDEHPTMKPVELVEACLKNSSAPGHLVFEPFSGSGSTLMACERLQRRCFALELDPRYCQAAVERWEKFTGQHHEVVGRG
jgi:DNA modification methylase